MKKSRVVSLSVAAALLLGYLAVSIAARTPNPVRLSFAALLTYHAAGAGGKDTDFLDGEFGPLIFRNRQSILSLRAIVLTGEISNTWGTASATWPTPMYRVGNTDMGGNCTLVHPWFPFLWFGPNRSQYSALARYVDAVVAGGTGGGLILP